MALPARLGRVLIELIIVAPKLAMPEGAFGMRETSPPKNKATANKGAEVTKSEVKLVDLFIIRANSYIE